jgi:hypothetical protein
MNKNSLGIKRYQFPRVVHRTTVRIFHTLLEEIIQTCRNFVQWSPKETAIPVEQPADISQRVWLYSHYKKRVLSKNIGRLYTPWANMFRV